MCAAKRFRRSSWMRGFRRAGCRVTSHLRLVTVFWAALGVYRLILSLVPYWTQLRLLGMLPGMPAGDGSGLRSSLTGAGWVFLLITTAWCRQLGLIAACESQELKPGPALSP